MGNNFVSKSSNESLNDKGIFVIYSYNENEVVPDSSVSLVPPSKLITEIVDFNWSDQTTKTTPGDNKYTTKLFRIPIDANNPKKQFLIKIDTKEGKMFSSKITYDRERINFLFQRVIIPKQEMSMLPVKFKTLKRWDEFRLYFKLL